jgi:hypothetical protein
VVPKPVVKHVPIAFNSCSKWFFPVYTPKTPQSRFKQIIRFFTGSEFSSFADLIDDRRRRL